MPCTTILAGRNVTADGSTLIARSEDYIFSPKKLITVLPEEQPRTYKTVTSHLEMELPEDPMAYTATPSVDPARGWWGAHGINTANVAMTATETLTANTLLRAADPLVELKKNDDGTETPGGIGEEDFVRIVLPYVRTAREGAAYLGSLLEKYGTYERNGIAFSDEKDVWWLETIGGHHWYACRVPEDKVVLMPNRLGVEDFDLADALGKGENFLCAKDLRDFCVRFGLLAPDETRFCPRRVFGTHADSDRLVNNPRAWDMARFLCPTRLKWFGENADYQPESNDIPWAIEPEEKITPEEIKYLLGVHFQHSPWDPYAPENAGKPPKYRPVAISSTNVISILQIRPKLPEAIRGVQWVSFGPAHVTAAVPFYTNVPKMPEYLAKVGMESTTENFCWASRILAAVAEPHYRETKFQIQGYEDTVAEKARAVLLEYDRKISESGDASLTEEANGKIAEMLKKETASALKTVLETNFGHMLCRFY